MDRSPSAVEVITSYVIVLLMILISASPIFSPVTRISVNFTIFLFSIWLKPTFTKRELNFFGLIALSFIVPILIDLSWAMQYGFNTLSSPYMLTSILFSASLASRINFPRFSVVFQNIVFALTLISLLVYAVSLSFPPLIYLGISYDYYGFPGTSLIIQNFLFNDEDVVLRNSGFASEPGVFQTYLNISLALGIGGRGIGLFKTMIYGGAILTSQSTAGIFIFLSIIALYAPLRIKFFYIAGIIIFIGPAMSLFEQQYESKVLTESAFQGRTDPAINALLVFIDNPLGFGSVRYTELYKDLNVGSWDAYTQISLRFGITGLCFLFFLLFRLLLREFGVAMAIALSFITNSFWFVPAIAVFFFFNYREGSPNDNCSWKMFKMPRARMH